MAETTIKANAVDWLASNFGVRSKSVYASKFYIPEKSRTGQSAWWLEIPRKSIEMPRSAEVHLLCQKAPDVHDFYYLKVPVEFFKAKLSKFDIREQGQVSLFLSAEPNEMFVDQRGGGNVSFNQFLMS
jgi:hypothetical protein